MKKNIGYSLLLMMLVATTWASDSRFGVVKEFYKGKTTCYCTEARDIGLTLTSKSLKGIEIMQCGEKSLVQIKVPADSLKSKSNESCAANAGTGKNSMATCWIKKNYIRFEASCPTEQFAEDPNREERPLCKDLGSVVGAGSCRKEK